MADSDSPCVFTGNCGFVSVWMVYSGRYYEELDGGGAGETTFDAELYARYTKQYDNIISIDQTDPYAKAYQRLLDLGLTHQVYELFVQA